MHAIKNTPLYSTGSQSLSGFSDYYSVLSACLDKSQQYVITSTVIVLPHKMNCCATCMKTYTVRQSSFSCLSKSFPHSHVVKLIWSSAHYKDDALKKSKDFFSLVLRLESEAKRNTSATAGMAVNLFFLFSRWDGLRCVTHYTSLKQCLMWLIMSLAGNATFWIIACLPYAMLH